jgi:protein arginine kinase activator
MQCQICKKKAATIHMTEISNGARAELHFCEQCAIQQGIAAKSQMSVNELLSNLLAAQPSDEELFGSAELETACPICGFTLSQFRKHCVLGCPHDYVVFERALVPLIERAHNGKTRHCGKVPSRIPQDTRNSIECANLRQQLETAIEREDYELAAELRDQIRQLSASSS